MNKVERDKTRTEWEDENGQYLMSTTDAIAFLKSWLDQHVSNIKRLNRHDEGLVTTHLAELWQRLIGDDAEAVVVNGENLIAYDNDEVRDYLRP